MAKAALEYEKRGGTAKKKYEKAFDIAAKEYGKKKDFVAAKDVLAEKARVLGQRPAGAENWTPLFNGKNLMGWDVYQDTTTTWSVDGGFISGVGGGQPEAGALFYASKAFDDFVLRVQAVAGEGRMIMFRGKTASTNKALEGYYVSLDPAGGETGNLGTLGTFVPRRGFEFLANAKQARVKAGDLVTVEIAVRGNTFLVKVDGDEVVKYIDQHNTYARGKLGLRCGRNDSIQVKTVEVTVPK